MEQVLTIRQPWASALFVAGKDVENRPRRTGYRGRLWIHAGKNPDRSEVDEWAGSTGIWVPPEPLPREVIIGCVELVDCVEDSDSEWAMPGEFHWLLRRPMRLKTPIAHTGSLSFAWRIPPPGELTRARRSRYSVR